MLPEGFSNPFRKQLLRRRQPARDPFGEPDITLEMAASFLETCDDYQLRLFAPMLFYGLRAAEPVFMFHELVDARWAQVACIEALDYTTKGRRNKRLPLLAPIERLIRRSGADRCQGLVYGRRGVAEGRERPVLLGASLGELVAEYQRRCAQLAPPTLAARLCVRGQVMRDAGALTYKLVMGEFAAVAAKLAWPSQATPKDLRHLFNACMTNAGMPKVYRRYLLGHALGKGAILSYTHLNQVAALHRAAVEKEMGPLLAILAKRTIA